MANQNNMIAQQAQLLQQINPFSQMSADALQTLLAQAKEVYFLPEELIIGPDHGVVKDVFIIKQGSVVVKSGVADGRELEIGDIFPVNAALGNRGVTSQYFARGDCFCFRIPFSLVAEVARTSPPLLQYISGQSLHLLELSRKQVQLAYSQSALAQFTHHKKLAEAIRRKPATVLPNTPLLDVLTTMHLQHIGSMLVVNDQDEVVGIFTRKDILGKVTLPQIPLTTSIGEVMTKNLLMLDVENTYEDATLLMARAGIRHVPITHLGKLAGIVSERDLFALQRLSLRNVTANARSADSVDDLVQVGKDIRVFARNMVSQGVQAKTLTEMISHLNDALTTQLIELMARKHQCTPSQFCWLSFGSEGRGEQTIATDQDNGLVFISNEPVFDRPRWLALANDINVALDRCGYPLCKGNIMGNNSACCLSLDEWKARFSQWVDRGTPEDLLAANIYFDFRPLSGNHALAENLREFVTQKAQNDRFLKLLSQDVLRRKVPIAWHGGLDGEKIAGVEAIDLKLRGTAILVDFARIMALKLGVTATNTRERLIAIGQKKNIPLNRSEAWITSFEYLQMLRLRVQMVMDGDLTGIHVGHIDGYPNHIDINVLNDIDRKLLKESFRMAAQAQKTLELEYGH